MRNKKRSSRGVALMLSILLLMNTFGSGVALGGEQVSQPETEIDRTVEVGSAQTGNSEASMVSGAAAEISQTTEGEEISGEPGIRAYPGETDLQQSGETSGEADSQAQPGMASGEADSQVQPGMASGEADSQVQPEDMAGETKIPFQSGEQTSEGDADGGKPGTEVSDDGEETPEGEQDEEEETTWTDDEEGWDIEETTEVDYAEIWGIEDTAREPETEETGAGETEEEETQEDVTAQMRAPQAGPTSTDLADFLTNVVCNAPVDGDGNYIINLNDSYDLSMFFAENENVQFDNDTALTYEFPSGMQVRDIPSTAFDINIVDENGAAVIAGNRFEVSGGRLFVRFNQDDPNIDRLKALANVAFQVNVSVSFDGSEGSIVFSSNVEKDFSFEATNDLTIEKSVQYDKSTDTASYVLKVTSVGTNQNVVIRDQITGTALTFNKDVHTEYSGMTPPDIHVDYDTVPNGFSVSIPEMANGESLTLTYTAAVNNNKITGSGTVEQTDNTAKVTSAQVPEGREDSADFSGKVSFHKISKYVESEPVPLGNDKYEVTWRLEVNRDHKLDIGGETIYDRIQINSRPFMKFAGDGIAVTVVLENGTTETRVIPWEELETRAALDGEGYDGWGYRTPESDGRASYVITCRSIIDASQAVGTLQLTNVGLVIEHRAEANTSAGYIGEDGLAAQKAVVGNTQTETEWALTVHVSGKGYPELRVVDDIPGLTYGGQDYLDYLQEDSIAVDGLQDGESFVTTIVSSGRTFVLRFYQDDGHTTEGLRPTEDGQGRDIIIRYKTTVNQEWLDLAAKNGYRQYEKHRNSVSVWVGDTRQPAEATVIPKKSTFRKDYVERDDVTIGGVDYPVYRYVLTLQNPAEEETEISDSFDTTYLNYYEAEGIRIVGEDDGGAEHPGGSASGTDTTGGMGIHITSFPKDAGGGFYPMYKIYYSLIVKDKAALDALNQAALEQNGYTLQNIAAWNELTSEVVETVYTYYPYVDKELVTQASEDDDYVAEFKLIINKFAEDLDPASDTLSIQDQLSSNMRFLPDSLTITPGDAPIRMQFDNDSNSLLLLDVPDNRRFEISYQARVLGRGEVTYSNTVKFGNYEKTVEETVTINSSGSGSGSNPSITLVKRDAEDLSVALAGARFQLFYMDQGTQVPVQDRNGDNVTFTTGSDGKVLIVGNQQLLGWTLWEGRTYVLVEVAAPAGYELNAEPTYFILSGSPASQMEYDLTGDQLSITNEQIRRSIPVTKRWIGPEAESITIRLLADDVQIDSAELSAAENWEHSFENLPKYDSADGHEIAYDVQEDPVAGYEPERSGSVETGFTFTNTITGKVSIPVAKEWIGPAAESVTIELLADNAKVAEAVLNEENNWQHTFTDLEKYNNGVEIEYKIQELEIKDYRSDIARNEDGSYTITNTNIETIDIPVEKRWIGPEAESITVRLLADDVQIGAVELSAAGNWKHTFENLPKYDSADGHEIAYDVQEGELEGYNSSITKDANGRYTITNINTGTIHISVTKKWVGQATEKITVYLFADGKEVEEVRLSADNHWKYTFRELEKYRSGEPISYTVKEEVPEGYRSKITGSVTEGFVITNTKIETEDPKRDETPKPSKPGTPATTTRAGSPKTGDESPIMELLILLLVSGGILIVWFYRKKRGSGIAK